MDKLKTYYWDACIFYEVVGDEKVSAQKKTAIDEILDNNEGKKNVICTSVMCHLEVIPSKLVEKDAGDDADYMALFDHEHFVDIEISTNILTLAREIKNYYYRPPSDISSAKVMDTLDAIHLATAIITRVDEFHTRDDDSKGSKIPLVSLYNWSGEPKICGKYDLKIVSPESEQSSLDLNGGTSGDTTK